MSNLRKCFKLYLLVAGGTKTVMVCSGTGVWGYTGAITAAAAAAGVCTTWTDVGIVASSSKSAISKSDKRAESAKKSAPVPPSIRVSAPPSTPVPVPDPEIPLVKIKQNRDLMLCYELG